MDINRKAFLEKISALGLGIVLTDIAPVFRSDDFYVNQKVGIIVKKPKGWQYLTKVELGLLYGGREEEQNVLCGFAYEEGDYVSPLIIISGYEKTFNPDTLSTFARFGLSIHAMPDYAEILPDYTLLKSESYQLNGFDVREERASYTGNLTITEPGPALLNTLNFTPNNFSHGIDIYASTPVRSERAFVDAYDYVKANITLA
ncbi:MAG TPA: hypothetical protein VK174_07955 [Chitinophagales bacterium]|nr:hypothetical protein [Chitinophagales bacterium]